MCATQDLDVLSTDEARPQNRAWLLAVGPAAFVVLIDQLTKIWAQNRLTAGSCSASADNCIDLILGLRFHLVYNQGAAFSTGEGLGPLFGVIALAMSLVLFNMARRRTDRWGPLILSLIAGGAIGNLLDRVFRADEGLLSGAVVDFIDLQWWPVFNVADSAVVVGVVALLIYSMVKPEAAGD